MKNPNNIVKITENQPSEALEVRRGEHGQFAKGVSGNPAGRPKRTQEEKDAMEAIRSLAPLAVETLQKILENPKSSQYARLQAIDIVLNRTYGRPDAALKLETAQVSREASVERVNALVAAIREEQGMIS